MKKSDRIAEFVQGLRVDAGGGRDPRLTGYFECFNSGRYYEAHDVLEDLWLRQGKTHPDHAFHKGLIQLAGDSSTCAFIICTPIILSTVAASLPPAGFSCLPWKISGLIRMTISPWMSPGQSHWR